MRVYVIGKYEAKLQVREVMAALERAGHTITCDWTVSLDASQFSGADRQHILREAALADAAGALTAEAVVVLHHPQLCGGLVEFGLAAADPKKLLCVLGTPDPVGRRQPIFYWLPTVQFFQTTEAVVQFLTQSTKKGWEQ